MPARRLGRIGGAFGMLLPLLLTPAAQAAGCPLAHAIYGQPRTGYSVRFSPRDPHGQPSTTNIFRLEGPGKIGTLNGEVSWGNGFSVPDTTLTRDCPEEPSEEQLEGCRYWEGLVYALGNRTADYLPEETAPAPAALLFTDLGRSLYYSSLSAKAEDNTPPDDVFTLAGCAAR